MIFDPDSWVTEDFRPHVDKVELGHAVAHEAWFAGQRADITRVFKDVRGARGWMRHRSMRQALRATLPSGFRVGGFRWISTNLHLVHNFPIILR